MCCVLCTLLQFCRFDKADATDVRWHCNHKPLLWYHFFPAQSTQGANILVCWIEKIGRTSAADGSWTLDFLRQRRRMILGTPYVISLYCVFLHLYSTGKMYFIIIRNVIFESFLFCGKLPVPWRPTNFDNSRAMAYCTCSRCGWSYLDIFSLIYHFLSSFSLCVGDGLI